jgi:hypothetical protein
MKGESLWGTERFAGKCIYEPAHKMGRPARIRETSAPKDGKSRVKVPLKNSSQLLICVSNRHNWGNE